MAISRQVIEHIAELARVEINNEKELEKMAAETDKIIAYFDKLKELDTSGIEAMEYLEADGCGDENTLRNDEVGKSYDREDLLCRQEEKEPGFFIVPRIVE